MGLERRILISDETQVPWDAVRSRLAAVAESPVLRMIDGELAFPDEVPSANWQELRVNLSGGMVTLRRNADSAGVVVWGNADATLLKSWNLLTWAVADATGGMIVMETGPMHAERFAIAERVITP